MSKILIIEDELAIAELERDYLELSGFEVEIENTGDGGLKRALEEKFDLFILDLTFIGWGLLSALTLGIGALWLNPYTNAAHAAFYRQLQVENKYTSYE